MKVVVEGAKPGPQILSTYQLAFFALLVFALVGLVAGLVFAIQDVEVDESEPTFGTISPGEFEVTQLGTMPAELPEASGLEASSSYPGVLWSHNDDPGPARLFALDETGRLLATFQVPGTQLLDFEDLARGPCPGPGPGDCLYLADTGDNNQSRGSYAIYVVSEPDPESSSWSPPITHRLDFVLEGNASRDIEAMTVLPDRAVVLVTKGQDGRADLYSLSVESIASAGGPSTVGGGEITEARFVATLPIDVSDQAYRVTGATTSWDGTQVAIRTGRSVHLFEVGGWDVALADCDFGPVEPQGEAITFNDANGILLAGESSQVSAPILRIRCP